MIALLKKLFEVFLKVKDMSTLLKDSNGNGTFTGTVLIITTIVCSLKLIASGWVISGFKMSDFGSSDYAVALGAAGALYWGRRKIDKDSKETTSESEEK